MQHQPRGTEALEEARKTAGVTQADVAAALRISVDTYRRRIRGQIPFTATELGIVRDHFGEDVALGLLPERSTP